MAKKINKNMKMVFILIVLAMLFMFFYGNSSGMDFSGIFASKTAAKPDLTPVAIKFNAATETQAASTTVSVKNQGTANAANVEVLVKDAFNNNLGTCTISTINMGETKSCDAPYTGMYAPNYEHAYIDPNRKISETLETNNDITADI